MKKLLVIIIVLFICTSAIGEVSDKLNWSELPNLPAGVGQSRQIGLAGAFTGMHNGVLITAGGANFPHQPPWMGGKKVWWDDIFVLRKTAGNDYEWISNSEFKLAHPLAYGVSISTVDGIVCIGGCDTEKCYDEVFLLKWDAGTQSISIEDLPLLPRPLAFMSGAKVGDVIYVAGGQETIKGGATKNLWALDLSKRLDESSFGWEELPAWPGPARILAVSAAQSNGRGNCFYLFSGRTVQPGKETELLKDAYEFNPKTEQWKQLADVSVAGRSRCIMAAPAIASGTNHILVFGGDDGKTFIELERLGRQIADASETEAAILKLAQQKIFENHPGFSSDILAYHALTDTWDIIGTFPGKSHVTTTAVQWDGNFIICSGEVAPGVRTDKVFKAGPPKQRVFGMVNYSILGVYLAALIAMGVYFSKREKSTDDFFRAGGRIPWWAAGLSIFGTQLSAITFMAIPAKSYSTDWRHFLWNMGIVMCAPVVIFAFLPFYRRLNVTTAYEYLEKRFNLAARLISSAMFIMFQLGRLAIVLFLPSIALSVVTGIDVSICIIVMGVLSIVYTVLGGIEAVIWTDVLQVIVLLGGAILCIIMIPLHIEGGFTKMLSIAGEASKMKTFDFEFSFFKDTFWVIIIGGFFGSLISYGSDQTVIQRYLTTRDEKASARGIWTNVILSIFATVLFFGMGTALYAFYKTHPGSLSPTLNNTDAIFPFYIVTQLPQGIAGLLIAGVFAASMSSLDSSMNSVATAVTTDFYRRFNADAEDRKCLNLARWVTVIVGLAGTLIALIMARYGVKSLWDQYNTTIGFFAGGLLGIFLLGMFTKRAHGTGAVVGLLLSGAVQFTVRYHTDIHFMLYTFTGVVSCVLIGYAASLIIPFREGKELGDRKLTVYNLRKMKKFVE